MSYKKYRRKSRQVMRYEAYQAIKPSVNISEFERKRHWMSAIRDIDCCRRWIYKGAIEEVHAKHLHIYKVGFSHSAQTLTFYDLAGKYVYEIVEGVYGMNLEEIVWRREDYMFAKRESYLSSSEIEYLNNKSNRKL